MLLLLPLPRLDPGPPRARAELVSAAAAAPPAAEGRVALSAMFQKTKTNAVQFFKKRGEMRYVGATSHEPTRSGWHTPKASTPQKYRDSEAVCRVPALWSAVALKPSSNCCNLATSRICVRRKRPRCSARVRHLPFVQTCFFFFLVFDTTGRQEYGMYAGVARSLFCQTSICCRSYMRVLQESLASAGANFVLLQQYSSTSNCLYRKSIHSVHSNSK